MAHCTTSVSWFISKFVFNLFTIIFVYGGFLKEKRIECLCAAAERDHKRQLLKGEEKSRSRCMCHRWRSSVYPCGCKRKKVFEDCVGDLRCEVTKQEEVSRNKCCCGK
ncbi:Protein of unknown function [Cotesia congregata]|uniref:Uncharacterized protein n=1 Tax=Cotesia congregata TaxID=51543 RepID=A0A8J2MLS5_COTCN|nr:Protein of unknown function [Cotesia congregata]CAG5083609.1 Protein of unknown function [Cotesia congregata]